VGRAGRLSAVAVRLRAAGHRLLSLWATGLLAGSTLLRALGHLECLLQLRRLQHPGQRVREWIALALRLALFPLALRGVLQLPDQTFERLLIGAERLLGLVELVLPLALTVLQIVLRAGVFLARLLVHGPFLLREARVFHRLLAAERRH